MDEQRFENEYAGLLTALRRRRGECPGVDALTAYAEDRLEHAEREPLERHLALCPACRELAALAGADAGEVDELTWRRAARGLDRRAGPWKTGGIGAALARRWPVAAAVAAALLVAVLVAGPFRLGLTPEPEPAHISTIRGHAIQAVAPAGPVEGIVRFDWSAPPLEARYDIEIRDGGDVIWLGSVLESSHRLPPEVRERLEPGRAYRWRVRAIGDDGVVLGESAWVEFEIIPPT